MNGFNQNNIPQAFQKLDLMNLNQTHNMNTNIPANSNVEDNNSDVEEINPPPVIKNLKKNSNESKKKKIENNLIKQPTENKCFINLESDENSNKKS